jgi:HD-GYP domain-containing protein (c-di-GMP phosphodiesterase class II)
VVDISSFVTISSLVFPRVQGPLPFDVYLRSSPEKFVKIFLKGRPIDTTRLESYVLEGVTHFHIHREDRHAYLTFSGTLLEGYVTANDFGTPEAQQILDETAENVLHEVFTIHDLNADTLKTTTNVVRSYVSIAKSNPGAFPQILKLAKTKKEIFRHCIMTSVFSTLLARALLPDDATAWLNAGLAGFLHDIGLGQLATGLDEHNATLPNELKKQIHLHPRFSAETLDGTNIAPIVQNAIRAHHEYWDGSGYPRALRGEEIPIIARIVTVTEHFANYVSGTSSGIALTPPMAIVAMKRSGKMDPALVSTFAKLLKIE